MEMSQQRQSFRYTVDGDTTAAAGVSAAGIRAFLVPKTTPTSLAQVRRVSDVVRTAAQGRFKPW
jgi:hypothetical protein